jgi:hypothetical protein
MNKRETSTSKSLSFRWRLLFSIPSIILTIAIFIISDMPQPLLMDLGLDFGDKILHFIAYFGYGICLSAFYTVNFQVWSKKATVLGILIFGAIFGMSDEFHQYFVPGRDCDFFDWLADFLGIIISITLLRFIKTMIPKIVERVNG